MRFHFQTMKGSDDDDDGVKEEVNFGGVKSFDIVIIARHHKLNSLKLNFILLNFCEKFFYRVLVAC